jgi:hypothetical protein
MMNKAQEETHRVIYELGNELNRLKLISNSEYVRTALFYEALKRTSCVLNKPEGFDKAAEPTK